MRKYLIVFCILSMIFCMQGKSDDFECILDIYPRQPESTIKEVIVSNPFVLYAGVDLKNPIPEYGYRVVRFQATLNIPNSVEKVLTISNIWESWESYWYDRWCWTPSATLTQEYIESLLGANRSGFPNLQKITGTITCIVEIIPPIDPETGRQIQNSYEITINRQLETSFKFLGKPKSKLIIGTKVVESDQDIIDVNAITYFEEKPQNTNITLQTTSYEAIGFSGYWNLNPMPPYTFDGDGWHSQSTACTIPTMGWFPIAFNTIFKTWNNLDYIIGAIYHRKELSGKWVVKFYKDERNVTEEFIVKELNYPGDNIIQEEQSDILGSGKQGTVLSGLTTQGIAWSKFGPVDSNLKVSGTFANPLWNESRSFYDAYVSIENGKYIIYGDLQSNDPG